ncbi:GroES-like protein [Whalleya microplaca]|nr:GroES-like protein [Whalleya microplaca]
MENPSVVLYGPLKADVEDRPIPAIDEVNDVIIRIAYVGVCGSDVHFWNHGGVRWKATEPLVMGHEASGIVHAVGPGVTSLVPGDRVTLEPGIPCRKCRDCKAGHYNRCPRMVFAASPPYHGTLTRYYPTSADFCYKIPDSMSLEEATLIEPLAVGVHAVRLAAVQPGNKVVVFGAGTVGLFCAAVARDFGASVVLSVDILESKLSFAKEFIGPNVGRTATPDLSLPPEKNARQLIEMHDLGDGADVVIDASGAESSVNTGIYVLRPGGVYVQVGMGKRKIEFPIAEVCEREISLKGSFRYGAGDFEMAVGLVKRGTIILKSLVSNIFSFKEAPEAWKATGLGVGIKNLIQGPGIVLDHKASEQND